MTFYSYAILYSSLLVATSATATVAREVYINEALNHNQAFCPNCQDIPKIAPPMQIQKVNPPARWEPCVKTTVRANSDPGSDKSYLPIKVEIQVDHNKLIINKEEFIVLPLNEYNKLRQSQ